MTLLQQFLERSAERLPDKTALVCGDQRLTYSTLDGMANRLANALLEGGVKRGDRVGIYLNNCIEAVVSIFAILKAGAVFVPVNSSTKRQKLVYILRNCGATGLVTGMPPAPPELLRDLTTDVPSLRSCVLARGAIASLPALDFCTVQTAFPATRPACSAIDLDLACLIYTSGTTGEPKGVMCDHSNIVFATDSIVEYLENREDDIILNALQLSYGYGLTQVFTTFRFGGTLVLEESFAYPAAIPERIQAERATGFPAIPTVFALLLEMDVSDCDLSSLRYMTNAAAALATDHILRLRRKFPRVTFYSMYGQTEVMRTLYLPPSLLDERPGSVGIAIPGTEVWLEDEAGNRVGPNQVGELIVRGRHVMRGYWGDPETSAHRFRPGPLPGERVCHTGDLFRTDEQGYFYFVSRQDDIIKMGGEKVAPKEIENVLYAMEGVVEAAVVGVPDPVFGYAPKAFIVCPTGKLTERKVLAHCRAYLENFMVPRYVEFRSSLPKTASGKIEKKGLR